MSATIYGDISPRTAAYVVKELLERGMPFLVFENWGQAKPIPANSSKSIQFRRYFLKGADFTVSDDSAFNSGTYFTSNNFDPTLKVLTEGVTPDATAIDKMDITATLVQYGDRTEVTDVVMDTHEDPILQESIEILAEQAAVLIEKARFNVLKAGTAVAYANGSARSSVNSVFTVADQNKVVRGLKRQLAKPLTKRVKSTPSYGTEPIKPGFIAVCHPDLEYDISAVTSFVPSAKYGNMEPMEGEFGKISDVRYISSTIVEPWTAVGSCGATGGTTVIENASSQAHVYPIIYLAANAYGLVPFKGKNAVIPMVVNPTPSDSDPLAQRGHAAWKAMQTTVILNDAWMYRAEVACTADGSLT